ncbi:uracil-DNA glycosylase family protein [Cribrihabitans sp. XS_ASV171]
MVALRERMEERYADWREDLPEEPVGADGQAVPGWRTFFAECPDPDWAAIPDALEIADDALVWPGRRNAPHNEAPEGAHICRAFDGIEPEGVRVAVLGQDPYPRLNRATGRAFEDGAWDSNRPDRVADSLQSIFQSAILTAHEDLGLQHQQADWDGINAAIKNDQIALPPELGAYFDGLAEQGVLFVNAAWTFSGTGDAQKKAHLGVWKPIVDWFLQRLAADAGIDVVFLFLGKKAQRRFFEADPVCRNSALVSNAHPSRLSRETYFKSGNPLTRVNKALLHLGKDPITWWPPAEPGA